MSTNHDAENAGPAQGIWDSLQKELIPYLLSILPDHLFAPGREAELFVALNRALFDKYVADGAVIPADIQFRLQLDICHLMPVFAKPEHQDELLKTVFDPSRPPRGRGPGTGLLSPPTLSAKIVTLKDVITIRSGLQKRGRRVVATNDCFDLLHVGQLRYLTEARALGDFLWV